MFADSYFAQTSGIQVSSLPINLMKLEGYFSGAAQAWLQVFDSCNAPQAGAVPKREFALYATAPFYEEFKNGAMPLFEGLFLAVSSTQGTYTQSAASIDIVAETDTQPISTHLVGDKTSAVNTLQVWSQVTGFQANPTKALYGLIITELLGQEQWICLFADDGAATWPKTVIPIQANQTLKLYWGTSGFSPVAAVLPPATPPTSANPFRGCTVKLCTTLPVPPAPAQPPTQTWTLSQTASSANILAITN